MGHSIHYYHFAVRAEALARMKAPDWKDKVIALLIQRQKPDGSYLNTRNALMKENDPLLCSALAVVALTEALSP